MPNKKNLMFWSLEILIVATLIWVCMKINFVFQPVAAFFSTLFIPVIISGFLYYMLLPLVKLLMKVKIGNFKINRTGAVAIVFIAVFAIIAMSIAFLLPKIIVQVENLITKSPTYVSQLEKNFQHFLKYDSRSSWLKDIDLQSYLNRFEGSGSEMIAKFMKSLTNSLGSIISAITNITVTVLTVPFMLFYMLKDGYKLMPSILKFVPRKRTAQVEAMLQDMSNTLSKYISGQAIECIFVGICTAIGYGLAGVPYALLTGIFAGATNIIPYIGPYIGLVPALILSLTDSFNTAVMAIIVCIIVQQIDGNLIYPNVIGKSVDIHPLTIILLLLVAGKIAGLLGIILCIPFYAIIKVIVKHVREVIILENESSDEAKIEK